ncbi:hypothetical protein [uncultured Pseudodesulfovibrio sp.]|uniref:hypothetical protein n=1 Tax=uncultured Pseudodesulfovibrio sp. TaxID=2035858 RepID=UPI0029C81172|nr:hypothetical protein [uncultured Pseudodesulfovibrio sp.]
MKELLNAIRTALEGIERVTVFVTPDENFLPHEVRLPAIGIKDGSDRRSEGVSMTMSSTIEVKIIPWVKLAKDEASILGDPASGEMGIIDLSSAIHVVLDDNLFSISGLESAFSSSETGSKLLGDERELLVNKVITYNYEKEGDRPCLSR